MLDYLFSLRIKKSATISNPENNSLAVKKLANQIKSNLAYITSRSKSLRGIYA